MGAVAGEGEPDDAVEYVEASGPQVEGLVHETQVAEGAQDGPNGAGGHQGVGGVLVARVGEAEIGVGEFLYAVNTETVGVVQQPEGGPRAREVELRVKHPVNGEQLSEQVEDLVHVLVHRAGDPLLVEQAGPNGGVPPELHPVARLFEQRLGRRQLPQVEVGAEEAQEMPLGVLDALDRGERGAPGVAADIGLGQRESLAREGGGHVGAVGTVAPEVLRQQTRPGGVAGDLPCLVVEQVEVLAVGQFGEPLGQPALQGVPVRPHLQAGGGEPGKGGREPTRQEPPLAGDARL